MNFSVKNTGLTATSLIILLTVFFLITIAVYPPDDYQTAASYLNQSGRRSLLPIIPSFLLVLANIPLFAALYFYAASEKKIFAMTGVLFGTGYMICSGTSYFIQMGLIAGNISGSDSDLISLFLMANPGSFACAIDNLGYLFLSLSFLVFAGIFYRQGFQSWLKAIFIIFGISGLLGALGYILNSRLLENLVLLSAVPYLAGIIMLTIEFKRLKEY